MNDKLIKRLVYALFICLSAALQAQIPTNGLIGQWTFSGNANDGVGSNHGTVSGASLTADRCGNPNSAYHFNGLNSYIVMLTAGPTGTVSRTHAFWVRTNSTAFGSPVASFDYGTANGAGGSYQTVWNYCGTGVGLDLSNQALIRSNACLFNNQWHHIAIVYDASISTTYTTVVFYLDGVAMPATVSCNVSGVTATINTGTSFPITIGRAANMSVRYFTGDLDDFYLYNRALTAAEVMQLYTSMLPCGPVVSGSVTICKNAAYTYSIPAIANATYSWTLPNGWTGTSNTNTISITAGSSAVSGVVSVTASSSCGVYTTTPLSVVVKQPAPLLASSNSGTICSGASATLSASGGTAYSWAPGAGSGSVVVVNPLTTTVFSVTIADTSGCPSVLTVTQNVVLAPNLTYTASATQICTGSAPTVTLSGLPGATYTWQPGNLGGLINTLSPTVTTTYSVTETVGSCTANITFSIQVFSPPVLSISSISVCSGQMGTLHVSGANSYVWSTGATGSSLVDSPPVDQTYTVVGNTFGCTVTATASISVLPLPIPFISYNSPVCEGGTLVLSGASGTAYAWSGPNAFTASSANVTISPVALANAGIYHITVTAANSCTAGLNATVVVNPLPVLSIAPASSSICPNSNSATLTAQGNAGQLSWQPSQSLSSGTSVTVSANPSATQMYTLTGTLNGCSRTTTALVAVVPPPNLNVSLSSLSTCAQAFNGSPNTITLTAGGALNYTISTPNDIYNSNPNGPVTNLATQPPHIPGLSTATVYGSNGACTLSTVAVFSIISNPTVSLNSYTPVICAGESFTYTSAGAGSYTWSSATPGQTIYTSGNVAVSSPTVNSIFSVSGNSLGCNSAIQSTTITVNPLPVLSINPHPAVTCLNVPITLTVSGTGTTFSWSPPWYLSSTQGSTVSADPSATQNYVVVASLNSCTASAAITVSVMPIPSPVISASQSSLCLGQRLDMEASGGITYSWTVPPGRQIYKGQHLGLVPGSLNYSGIYTLTASGPNGCLGSTTTSITVVDNPYGYLKSDRIEGCVPFPASYVFVPVNYARSDISGLNWYINSKPVSQKDTFQYYFNVAGSYSVAGVVNATNGCANTVTMTVEVHPKPVADFTTSPAQPVEGLDEVVFTNASAGQGLSTANWHFYGLYNGEQLAGNAPVRVYETSGIYPVALVVSNAWNCTDTVVKPVTILPDVAIYVPEAFTPDADNRNELFYPVTRGITHFQFDVFDRWGNHLFSTSNTSEGWNGTYKGSDCKEDSYAWKISATGRDGSSKELTGMVLLLR